jgi:hypothetical protein
MFTETSPRMWCPADKICVHCTYPSAPIPDVGLTAPCGRINGRDLFPQAGAFHLEKLKERELPIDTASANRLWEEKARLCLIDYAKKLVLAEHPRQRWILDRYSEPPRPGLNANSPRKVYVLRCIWSFEEDDIERLRISIPTRTEDLVECRSPHFIQRWMDDEWLHLAVLDNDALADLVYLFMLAFPMAEYVTRIRVPGNYLATHVSTHDTAPTSLQTRVQLQWKLPPSDWMIRQCQIVEDMLHNQKAVDYLFDLAKEAEKEQEDRHRREEREFRRAVRTRRASGRRTALMDIDFEG